jgi:DNA-directed RNA polymerase specialized sigma24 family protein
MELYEVIAAFKSEVTSIARLNSRKTRIAEADFISAMNVALWKAHERYVDDGRATLQTYLRTALRNATIDVIRGKQGGHARRVFAILDKPADEDTLRSEPADIETVDYMLFTGPNARKAHQLELIRSLVDETDSPTMSLVEAYLDSANQDARRTQIAKSVGLHHKVADDKLRKLSRRFDANRFGEIHEYLAV